MFLARCGWVLALVVACNSDDKFSSDPDGQGGSSGSTAGTASKGGGSNKGGATADAGAPGDAGASSQAGTSSQAGAPGDAGSSSGGSAANPSALGAACESEDECDSGHCVDGVCCESACGDACQDCSSEGLCDVVPVHDDACLPVTCPSDTSCRSFEAEISGDLCASLGQCKTAADCPYEDQADRTECGEEGEVCRSGVCKYPTTQCGATAECSTFCCERLDMNTRSCAASTGSSCGASANINDADTGLKVLCDEQADCGSGEWCCLIHANNSVTMQCSASCGATHAVGANYILCESPAATSSCPESATCTAKPANSLPAGFTVCTIP
jgi:hypothetical protein